MTHAELIAEQLTNIESLGDELPAVIAAGALRKLLRHLDEAHGREINELKKQVADLQQQLPKPDPNWRDICAKCFENGATEPPNCEYYTEDGCMSPIPDQHPLIQVGDMAKLRDALGKLRAELWNNTVIAGKRKFELYEIADAALAAPPRNCDVGTPHEQADRAFAFCLGRSCKTCEFTKLTFRECTLKWAQLPCGKGGAK